MLGWSEEGQEGVLWLGVVWASLSILEPADGHSPLFGVKSCLWALWPAFTSLWLAVVFELFAERWGTVVEDVDHYIAIVVVVALSATADVVDLDSFWEEVGRVLDNWSPESRFWSVNWLRWSNNDRFGWSNNDWLWWCDNHWLWLDDNLLDWLCVSHIWVLFSSENLWCSSSVVVWVVVGVGVIVVVIVRVIIRRLNNNIVVDIWVFTLVEDLSGGDDLLSDSDWLVMLSISLLRLRVVWSRIDGILRQVSLR